MLQYFSMEIPVSRYRTVLSHYVEIHLVMTIVEEVLEDSLQFLLMNPPKNTWTTVQVVFPEQRFKATNDVEGLGFGLVTTLLGYIPLQKEYSLPIIIRKNSRYPLANPTISKGVHVMTDIMANMNKLTFSNHDLRKFPKLHMSKYMMLVQLMEFGPLQLQSWIREVWNSINFVYASFFPYYQSKYMHK